jgi:hypothetical protein
MPSSDFTDLSISAFVPSVAPVVFHIGHFVFSAQGSRPDALQWIFVHGVVSRSGCFPRTQRYGPASRLLLLALVDQGAQSFELTDEIISLVT